MCATSRANGLECCEVPYVGLWQSYEKAQHFRKRSCVRQGSIHLCPFSTLIILITHIGFIQAEKVHK